MLIYAALKSCGYFVKIFCTLYECYFSSSLQDIYYFFLTGGEIDYVKILNRVLPNDIRVMGWSPAPTDFSARYLISCHLLPITFADRIFMAFLNEEKKFQFEQEVNPTWYKLQVQLFEQGIQILLLERKFRYHGMHVIVYDTTYASFLPVHYWNTLWVWIYFFNVLNRQWKLQERNLSGNTISEIFVRWMQLMSTTIGDSSHHLRFSHAMKGIKENLLEWY